MTEWLKELEAAEKAVYSAGERLKKVDPSHILDSSGRDVKHSADFESEKLILDSLGSGFNYPVLAEETSKLHPDEYKDRPTWIVDPLDGTLNYTRGINFCCISVALWKGNEPLLGIIYDFQRDELFKGVVGQGAFLNNTPIAPTKSMPIAQAVLASGFPVNRNFSSIGAFIDSIIGFKKVRLFGSAGLSLAYTACGRVDAYFEEDIMLWDIAAGAAIVKASGGFVTIDDSIRTDYAKTVHAGDVFRGENKL